MKKELTKPRSITATDSEWKAIKAKAAAECLTVSQYLRRLVKKDLSS